MHEDCTSSVTDKNKRRISGCAVASRWRWHPLIDQPRVMPVPPDPNADVEVAGGGDVDYADTDCCFLFGLWCVSSRLSPDFWAPPVGVAGDGPSPMSNLWHAPPGPANQMSHSASKFV